MSKEKLIFDNKGIIFTPAGQYGWMNSHGQVPTILVKKDYLRIYFSTRPRNDLSLTTFIDVDINDFSKITYINSKPILALGEPGTFDEFGIMPASIIEKDGFVYLYYSGWSRGVSIPYSNYTGLAISKDGGMTFEKYSKGPIIDRKPFEIYSATSPEVKYFNGKWHMWYCSGTNWHLINNKYEHTYDIKYAHSKNGINWVRTGISAISQKNKFEAITRPTVIKINNQFIMYYCYRGSKDFRNGKTSYKIGYATSKDLINWVRDDKKIKITPIQEWDSKMRAYPCVVKVKKAIYLFYNGNMFGKDGIGYAKLKGD